MKIMEEDYKNPPDELTIQQKVLSSEEREKLCAQSGRLVPEHKAIQLEQQAQRHWDLFYKRNETRFFKDRRWTTREFQELLYNIKEDASINDKGEEERKIMLEVGCGVGNLIFPLTELNNFFIYACDFSPRAIEFVKKNPLYSEECMKAFQCDITTTELAGHIDENTLDIVTMVFVLSAIHPDKFIDVFRQIYSLLKPGGVLLFRDYGLYDMAQLRFKPGHKISDNFYMRQDGTRSYYFAEEELAKLVTAAGFEIITNGYINRRTVNVKENIDTPRIFIQGKFIKN